MDPTTTLSQLLIFCQELSNESREPEYHEDARCNAVERCEALSEWLQRGGFPPNVQRAVEESAWSRKS